MSATRLMTYGVYVLGASMVVAGLMFVSHGVPIVRMELGWTEIMAGSVVASAGCIVLVLGLLLQHLEAMRDTVERVTLPLPAALPQASLLRPTFGRDDMAAALAEVRAIHPLAPALQRNRVASEDDVRPEPALPAALHPAEPEEAIAEHAAEPLPAEPVLAESAPALVFAEEEDASHGPAVTAPDPVDEPVADPATPIRANFLAAFLARRAASPDGEPAPAEPLIFARPAPPASGRPVIPSRRTSIDLSSGWGDIPADHSPGALQPEPDEALASHLPVDPPTPKLTEQASEILEVASVASPVEPAVADRRALDPEPDPLQPVVVGRYNAGAAAYVMYSNGMIEVETEEGTHQFASMQDLKAFIERRDAQVS